MALAEWITRISGTAKPSDAMSLIHTSQSAGLAIVFFIGAVLGAGSQAVNVVGNIV